MAIHKIEKQNPKDATVVNTGRSAVTQESVGDVLTPEVSPEQQKDKIQEYHARREAVKAAQKKAFDSKTGEPIINPDPVEDEKFTKVEPLKDDKENKVISPKPPEKAVEKPVTEKEKK